MCGKVSMFRHPPENVGHHLTKKNTKGTSVEEKIYMKPLISMGKQWFSADFHPTKQPHWLAGSPDFQVWGAPTQYLSALPCRGLTPVAMHFPGKMGKQAGRDPPITFVGLTHQNMDIMYAFLLYINRYKILYIYVCVYKLTPKKISFANLETWCLVKTCVCWADVARMGVMSGSSIHHKNYATCFHIRFRIHR